MRQQELLFPLLEVLEEAGGDLPAAEACEAVAERVGGDRSARVSCGGQDYSKFDRDVRWARQRALLEGMVSSPKRGQWKLTGTGRKALRRARPGVVVAMFVTRNGVALWSNAEDAIGLLEDGSVDLVYTSPPYMLAGRKKDYGNLDGNSYLDWLTDLAAGWKEKLRESGSAVLNLEDAYLKGVPYQSLYIERLLIRLVDDVGFRLCQNFAWHKPNPMAVPGEWVNKRRIRLKSGFERVIWLSLGQEKCDNRKVLQEYSEGQKRLIAQGGQEACSRPSGHSMKAGAFGKDNGGAIPSTVITASNSRSRSAYKEYCETNDLPQHPARQPAAVAQFFMKLLCDRGDLVFEPFGGSQQACRVAEDLDLRWVSSECMLDYVLGGVGRFPSVERVAGDFC